MSNGLPDLMDMRIDGIVVLCTIDSLKKYLDLVEAKIKEVWEKERKEIESDNPADEEERDIQGSILRGVDLGYETELYPAMRYSFIVLVHIVTETELRKFCSTIQKERKLTISLSDLKGSAIDQTWTFLSKVVGIPSNDLPTAEWEKLRSLQKIRNCIAHAHGWVRDSGRDETFLKQFALTGSGVTIGPEGRLQIEKVYCDQQLDNLRSLFIHLFKLLGWS